MAFHGQMQAGIGQHNSRNLGQTLTRARQQFEAAALEQNVRHVRDESASRVACCQHRVQLLQQARAEILLLLLRLLAKLFRLGCSLASLIGFRGQSLLLRQSFRFGLLGFLPLASGFLRGLLGLGFRHLGLCTRSIRVGTRFCLRVGVRPGSGCTVVGCFLLCSRLSLGLIFGFLLHGHDARFFRNLGSLPRGRFDRFFILLAAIGRLCFLQLLVCLRDDGGSIFIGRRKVCDPHRVARFKQFAGRGRIDSENRVLDMRVYRRIGALRQQLISSGDIFSSHHVLKNNRVPRL